MARDFHVIAPDLPGHAFTQTPAAQALSLPAVAAAVDAMLQRLGRRPTLLVGHSAGAAVALRMVLDGRVAPALTVSINGALLPLEGPLGRLLMPMARLLAANPFVPPAFAAWAALPTMTRRLLDSTGSRIEALGERCYAHLVATPAHAAGALRLMSAWDLTPLASELPHLDLPLLLLAAGRDRTLPPEHAQRVLRLLPKAGHALLPGFGHLVHEEDAPAVLAAIRGAWPGVRAAAPARLVA